MQPDEIDWKVLLGQLLIAKQQVRENDRDGIESTTLPREKATEADIAAFEERVDGHIDAHYRRFLLHANGWPNVLYDVGLFGLPEFEGTGNWSEAIEQLGIYNDEGVLADAGLDADQVVPIAAGEGTIALIVIVRPDAKNAGTVMWFDGGEVDRWPNFAEFFLSLIANEQAQAEKLAARSNESAQLHAERHVKPWRTRLVSLRGPGYSAAVPRPPSPGQSSAGSHPPPTSGQPPLSVGRNSVEQSGPVCAREFEDSALRELGVAHDYAVVRVGSGFNALSCTACTSTAFAPVDLDGLCSRLWM